MVCQTTIEAADLRDRLVRAGHFTGREVTGGVPDVWPRPTPETIVTVGANLDPTVRPEYSSRYFACYIRSPEELIPVLRDDPAFALPEPLLQIAADGPVDNAFMDGPFRWLLSRLARFEEVLLWPERREAESSTRAVVLDLGRETDCRTLWQAAAEASRSVDNFYASDFECREVYVMHHHDKVVACIPDGTLRDSLVRDLEGRPDIFEDCSGYATD